MLKSPFAYNQDEMDMMVPALPGDDPGPGELPGELPGEGQPVPPGPVPNEWVSPGRPRRRALPPLEDPMLEDPMPEMDEGIVPDPVPLPLPAPPNTPTGVGGTFSTPANFSARMTAGGGLPPGTSAYGPGAPLAPDASLSDEELLKGITRRR